MGVSDDLSDDAIMRSIRAIRAGNAIWKDLLPILKRVERELVDKIEEIGGTRSFQSARAERMLREIRRTIDGGAQEFYRRLEVSGVDLAGIEAKATADSFSKRVPIDYDFTVPAARLMKSVATELPFEGAVLRDHMSKWSADTIFRMQGEMRTALLQGETIEQMQRRLRGVAEIKTNNARTLARTYASHVTNGARAETYAANADVIAGEMWTATLDDRTCLRCGPLDNKVFKVGKGPKAPLHMNCRCVRAPIIKGRDDLIKAGLIKPGSRASIDGQVPDSLKFEDWLRRQSPARQKEVLGAKRLKMWRNGTKLDKFVNDENQIIPLDELRKPVS